MLKGSCLVSIDRQVPDSVSVAEALYQISVEQTKPKVKLEISIEYLTTVMFSWVLSFLCVGLMPTDARHFETAQVCNVFISNLVLLINPGTSQDRGRGNHSLPFCLLGFIT